jgi:hypothetical protein
VSAAYARFLEALSSNGFKYKADGRGRARAQCPGHNGDDLNLAVAIGDQGVLLRCHSYDCPAEDIARALSLELSDLFDQDGRAVYHYPNGHDVFRYRTRDGKEIVQRNHPGQVTELYRHPDSQPIEDAEFVVVVEGEKSVDAALRLGIACVTTWPGGAKAVDKVNIDPLMGKRIRLIADNDEPGRAAMAHLEARLRGVATVESISVAPKEKQGVDDIWLDGGELRDLVPLDVSPYKADEPEPERTLALTTIDKVVTRKPRFLWENMIPYGAFVLMAGKGGVAKSTFAIYLAGGITRGVIPGHLFGQPSDVLYVSHEDSLEEIVKPRALANGVDTARFHRLGIRSKHHEGVSVPRLPEDIDLIRQAIAQTGAKVIIIDPITSTLGGDNDKLADVRAVVDPLNQMGQELGVSILGIAHFRKGGGAQSDMVSGSHAWRDASRGLMVFAKEESMDEDAEDNPPTIITIDKGNGMATGKSYQYRTDVVEMLMDDGQTGTTTKIQWLGTSKRSVGEVINREQDGNRQGYLAQALKAYIDAQPGAVPTKTIVDAFADQKPNTVTATLKRMGQRNLIHSPAWGFWQSMKYAPSDAK